MAMNILHSWPPRFGILGFAHGALGVVRQNMKKKIPFLLEMLHTKSGIGQLVCF